MKSETRKSEDLASLLKIREKALIDRFKGQIAWLQLQKQKLKESGLTAEISMIKKKQRALLLRFNNDRKELHRLMKEHQQIDSSRNPSNMNFNAISHMSTTNMSIRTSVAKQYNVTSPKRALKAIELPGGGAALEMYVYHIVINLFATFNFIFFSAIFLYRFLNIFFYQFVIFFHRFKSN